MLSPLVARVFHRAPLKPIIDNILKKGTYTPLNNPQTYAAAIESKSDSKTTRKSYTTPPKLGRPLRLFLRLPTDHPARQASPYAVLQKLRDDLGPTATNTIKEIQHVPTGLAIGPRDSHSGQILLDKKEEIQQTIQGSNAESEQKWAIFVIPELLNSIWAMMAR